jgi:UDP-glucose 4-epimerase
MSILSNMNFTNKNILILGGLGFIGSNLAKKCIELGGNVTIIDSLDKNCGGNIFNIESFKDDIQFKQFNILDELALKDSLTNQDYVFNCAGHSSHVQSMKNPYSNLDVNCRAVINLLEILKNNNEVVFVHLGTTSQFGKLIYQPADENHPEFPIDIYSAHKSLSEKYVLLYSKAYGMKNSVVRLPNTYGPRASIHSANFTFNNYFIGLALQNKNIYVYGSGEQLRNNIYVEDAIDALILSALSNESIGQAFLATHNDHHTLSEIAEATSSLGLGKVEYIDWPEDKKNIEVGHTVISNQKIKEILNWSPNYSLQEGLDLAKEFFEPRLEFYIK